MANPHKINVKIVTPEKTILKGEYDQITLPTSAGELGILANHAPLVSTIKPGEIRLINEGHTSYLAISKGFLEVRHNSEIILLADTAEPAEQIDLQKAEDAKKRAEQIIKQKDYADDADYAKMQAIIEKEMARLKVGHKYKNVK